MNLRRTRTKTRRRGGLVPGLCALVVLLELVPFSAAPAAAQKREKGSEKAPIELERRTGHGAVPAADAAPAIPPGVAVGDGLTDDEAVAVALWNNTAFHADLAALGIARADLVEAGLLKNPIFSLLFPLGPKQFEATITFPLEVFWQRPRRVAAAKADFERVAVGLEQNALNLVRDVRVAYVDLLLAGDRERLAAATAEVRREVLALVEARFRAGEVAELEVVAARADLGAAEEALVRRRGESDAAHERLVLLLGLPVNRTELVAVPPSGEPSVPPSVDPLVRDALASRPDLRAAELAVDAAAKRAKWEHSRIATLGAILDMNGSGKNGFEAGPGLSGELPVFNRNQGGIRRADAEVERAARQFLATRHRIVGEVRESYAQLEAARAALDAWRTRVLPDAKETVRVAERAYLDGEESYLFVLEATRKLVDASAGEAQALADLRRAEAQLERHTGRKRGANP